MINRFVRRLVLPAAAACAVLLPLSALVPVLALHLFNRGSIVEKLRTLD